MKEEINRIKKKQIPDLYQNLTTWETNRRTFLKGALLTGALTQISLFTSCSTELEKGNDLLTAEQATILTNVIDVFFPDDGNGPGAKDINAFGYIMWVLHDSLGRSTEDNDYILEGIQWADDTAQELYFKPFVELSDEEKKALIGIFTELDWGKNWSSVIIFLILEALLLDPLYGGNVNEVGWNWLNHTPGYPRPTEENRYERIMEKQLKLKA
jgi:hypothetical protein